MSKCFNFFLGLTSHCNSDSLSEILPSLKKQMTDLKTGGIELRILFVHKILSSMPLVFKSVICFFKDASI